MSPTGIDVGIRTKGHGQRVHPPRRGEWACPSAFNARGGCGYRDNPKDADRRQAALRILRQALGGRAVHSGDGQWRWSRDVSEPALLGDFRQRKQEILKVMHVGLVETVTLDHQEDHPMSEVLLLLMLGKPVFQRMALRAVDQRQSAILGGTNEDIEPDAVILWPGYSLLEVRSAEDHASAPFTWTSRLGDARQDCRWARTSLLRRLGWHGVHGKQRITHRAASAYPCSVRAHTIRGFFNTYGRAG
jgi:hypothetical protein